MNQFSKYLIAEIITIILVTLSFIFISPPLIAGRIAGSFFIAMGLYICLNAIQNSKLLRSASFSVACVHLLLSFMMVYTRFTHPQGSFAEVNILGMPGPIYHKVATSVYIVLIASTVFDYFLSRKKLNQLKPNN